MEIYLDEEIQQLIEAEEGVLLQEINLTFKVNQNVLSIYFDGLTEEEGDPYREKYTGYVIYHDGKLIMKSFSRDTGETD